MAESKTTIYYAMVANGIIATAKGVGGVLTGSSALLAETAHSIADTTNQVLLRVSLDLGSKPPDEEHPFGHGRERFFWAFLVAVMMFVGGAVFSVGRGVWSLFSEGGETGFLIAYIVLGVSLVAETIALARAARQVRQDAEKAGIPFRKFLEQSTDPTVKTVLFEDAVAVAGVVVALVGVGLHQLTHDHLWDAVAAILIGLLLVYTAYRIGRDTKSLLIGEAARPEERAKLREAILGYSEVTEIHDLRTTHVGPASLLVVARLGFRNDLDARRIEEISAEIERSLKGAVGDVGEVYLDATGPRGQPAYARGDGDGA